jgi:alpha-L-arabinofuranosidase
MPLFTHHLLYSGWMNQLPVVAGWKYTASFWARSDTAFSAGSFIVIGLYDTTLSTAYATAKISAPLLTSEWAEYSVTLNVGLLHYYFLLGMVMFLLTLFEPQVGASSSHNVLAIILPKVATQPQAWFNLISLFPPTFNNVPNGLRVDLAQALADIKPKYIRWPGASLLLS